MKNDKRYQEKSTVAWLLEFAAPYKTRYIASVIFAIIGVACGVAPYLYVGRMIIHLFQNDMAVSFYIRNGGIMACFWLLRYAFHGLSTALSHRSTFSVVSEIRLRLTKKLTKLPMGYLLDTPSGKLKSIIVEKAISIEPTLAHIVPEMSANLLGAVSIVIYLFVLDWRMALVSLITLPIGIFCYMGMMKGYETRFSNYVEKNKNLNAVAVEYINGIEVIKAFNQSASSYAKFATAVREAAASAIDWMRSCQGYFAAAMSVLPAVLVGVLPIGSIFYMGGSLPAETFMMSVILSLGIMTPLITAMSYTDSLAQVNTILGEIAEVLEQPDMIRPKERKELTGRNILLHEVSFAYGEQEVLHKVNLSVEAGCVTALVGPSGGGKSTIAKLIASMWDVSDGAISIGGVDIKDMPLSQVNENIAYVSQDNYLFDDTVRNNIRMGKPAATDEEVEQAAKKSGCHDFIMELEGGYETVAGGGGAHLSGGERQRITIARAMLKNAPIIILDEATAYTDPESEAVIQTAVSKLVAGKTLVVIAHRLSTITDSDKIAVIAEGAVLAQGTHESLLESCGLYQDMWSAHLSAKDDIEEGVV